MSDLICWTLATGMRCMAMTGPVNAPFTDFYIQNNHSYAAPALPRSGAQYPNVTPRDWDDTYRKMGWRTSYEYFCQRAVVHPMDAEMCARGPHR